MSPYWIKTEGGLGVGITAESEAAAMALFALVFGGERKARSIEPVKAISELDQGHVRPNMGNWFVRGVWFPLGFEQARPR